MERVKYNGEDTAVATDGELDNVLMLAVMNGATPVFVPAAPILARALSAAIEALPAVDWTPTINLIVNAKLQEALQDVPLTTGLEAGRYELEVLSNGSKQWVPAAPAAGSPPLAPTIDDVEGDNEVSVAEAADGVTITGTAEALSTVSVLWGGINKNTIADEEGDWSVTYTSGQIPPVGETTVSATATNSDGTSPVATKSVTVLGLYSYGAETAISDFALRTDPTASKPGYLNYITDALTGFRVYRVTDRTTMSGGRILKHWYAKSCPFTADGSKLWVNAQWNDAPVINATTLAYINKRTFGERPVLSRNLATPDRFYTMWSNSGGRTIFGYQDLADSSGDFTENTIHDFAGDGYSAVNIGGDEGNQTNDDRFWPMIGTRTSNGTCDFFIYDMQEDTLSAKFNVPASSVESCDMSPDGNFMLVALRASGGGRSAGVHVFNSSMVYQRTLSAAYNTHGAIAVDTDGNVRFVWNHVPTAATATLRSARLDNGSERVEIPAQYCAQIHVSAACYRRPGYVLISSHDDDPSNYKRRGWNEAYFVKLDGTGTIERVSYLYHPSNNTGTYESQAWASCDPDGYQVVWASCWHNGNPGSSNIETYLARKLS